MIKIRENKTRKKLRITQCVLYLIQIFMCTLTFVHIPNPDSNGHDFYATVFDMLGYIGGSFPDISASAAFQSYYPYFFIFPLIPIVGFFFCALDKERNLKNIVSVFCCLFGVLAILLIVTLNFMDIGSMLSLLFYILISFITAIAMMARIADNPEKSAQ